jgi:hypothetical protein
MNMTTSTIMGDTITNNGTAGVTAMGASRIANTLTSTATTTIINHMVMNLATAMSTRPGFTTRLTPRISTGVQP